MVFSSLLFLFGFLPLCLAVYYATPSRDARNVVLTAFSLVFYAWGEPVWILLLLLSSVVDWLAGLYIGRHQGRPRARLGLLVSLAVNLSLLVSFKYADFIVDNVNALAGLQLPRPGFLLPIGISFYTFQTISYTVDVYRGEVAAQRRYLNFLLFVSSFHQLVAGPIVRYAHVAREIETRVFRLEDFSAGVTRFCRGLFKKVFIANVAGELCVLMLDKGAPGSVAAAWFGLLMFTLQIYFDFSGYSDMAIGLGRMFGFQYHENFRHPYTAASVTDFWRRWHISLGSFFRDYVYIPLGGNRRHATRNILIVWGLTGLWHGASWNFVLWGLYFGGLLLLEKRLLGAALERSPRMLRHAYALLCVMLGWAIFYFTDLERLAAFLKVLCGLSGAELVDYEVVALAAENALLIGLACLLCMPLAGRVDAALRVRLGPGGAGAVEIAMNAGMLIASVALLVGKAYNPFIYFRF